MFLMQFALLMNSRKNEFRADAYSVKLGYGEYMIDTLYLLEKMNLSDNATVTERLTAYHPRIQARIGALEKILEEEEEDTLYLKIKAGY